jgi:hypothetical protein
MSIVRIMWDIMHVHRIKYAHPPQTCLAAPVTPSTPRAPLTPFMSQVLVLGVSAKPRPCIMVSFCLPHGHKASSLKTALERTEYWKDHGHGTLPIDALVCLVRGRGQPLLFASVVRREVDEMAAPRPMVGLSFEAGQEAEAVLQYMGRQEGAHDGLALIQVMPANGDAGVAAPDSSDAVVE